MVLVAVAAGLHYDKSTPPSNKISVVASFYPLYYFSEQIGGNKADVVNITPSGAEPHDYEPTGTDMVKIANSRLLILNGGGLEAWGSNVQKNIDSKRTLVVTAGDGLANQTVTEDNQDIIDPHVWLSPLLAKKMVDKIAQGFITVDPNNSLYYQTNADVLKTQLDKLDADYQMGLQNCLQKDIVTSHAAFGYLATAYGLNQVSIAGLSPDAEPSPKQLADIAIFAKNKKIDYIFFESLVSPKLSQTIAQEIGAKTMVLNPIEGMTVDDLNQGKNYFTEMEKNLTNLKIALQCQI